MDTENDSQYTGVQWPWWLNGWKERDTNIHLTLAKKFKKNVNRCHLCTATNIFMVAQKTKWIDIHVLCHTINAPHLWIKHRWYGFVLLFSGRCPFSLRRESAGSLELPMLITQGFRGMVLNAPGISTARACRMGLLKLWKCLPGFPPLAEVHTRSDLSLHHVAICKRNLVISYKTTTAENHKSNISWKSQSWEERRNCSFRTELLLR